ncbi:50S ribosomal protein L3 [Gammaproteobacteria bacterium]|nr:50S ribosomal protein L3 [Gammaproteobacteria bacterium]
MSIKLLLKKEGMTSVNVGSSRVPVTLLSFSDHVIVQIKTVEKDGYSAIQVASGPDKKKPVKPMQGHYADSSVQPKRHLFEYHVEESALESFKVGEQVAFEILAEWAYVDAQATSKGKGFSGAMKAWNFAGQRASHGVSISHRKPGSIGQCQDPGRVFKGKKMAKRLGGVTKSILALEVVSIDAENKTIAVKGSVPGSRGSFIFLNQSLRKTKRGS